MIKKLRAKLGEEDYRKVRTVILLTACVVLTLCFSIVKKRACDIASYEMNMREKGVTTTQTDNQVSEIGSGRGKLWYRGIHLAMQKPFFGWGLENIIYQYDKQFDIGEGRSHNLIVQLSATTGFVGMLLYISGIASLWIRQLKNMKTWDTYDCLGMAVIVSYIVSSFVGNSSFYASPYFNIFVGFVVLKKKEQ